MLSLCDVYLSGLSPCLLHLPAARAVVGVAWPALAGGGGLHCMTTQLEGAPAAALLGALWERLQESRPVGVLVAGSWK